MIVSIHTPRVGSDRGIIGLWLDGEEFQSTLPVWGATRDKLPKFNNNGNFNPHSPYGERLPEAAAGRIRSAFQSTLPVWGATYPPDTRDQTAYHFNPHSPYGERPLCTRLTCSTLYFNPHSPYGERLFYLADFFAPTHISIHTPRMGSDLTSTPLASFIPPISIHTPRMGSDSTNT